MTALHPSPKAGSQNGNAPAGASQEGSARRASAQQNSVQAGGLADQSANAGSIPAGDSAGRGSPEPARPGIPDLNVYPLRVLCRAVEAVALPAFAGSAVRGALFGAVRELACVNQSAPSCAACPLHTVCGVSRLLATVDADGERGADPPRPFAIRPPLRSERLIAAGESFSFGITLFGDEALQLFPYVALGLRRMGENGLGRALPGRGRFTVERVNAVNPFLGLSRPILSAGNDLVTLPDAPLNAAQLLDWSGGQGRVSGLTVHFRTPVRLVVNKQLVKRPAFEPLMRCICRRVTDLARGFGGSVPPIDYLGLLEQAAAVRLSEDRTHWLDLDSKSARQGRTVPIGGLLGRASYAGELTPFLPWLLWASFLGVGKDVTKGNGVLDLELDRAANGE